VRRYPFFSRGSFLAFKATTLTPTLFGQQAQNFSSFQRHYKILIFDIMTGNGLRPLRTTSKRRRSTPRSPSEYGSSPQGDHTGDTPIGAEMGIENPDYATHETIETETSASRRSSLETKKERKRSRKACDNCKAKKRKVRTFLNFPVRRLNSFLVQWQPGL